MNFDLSLGTIVVTLVSLIVGITLHEMMHAYTAFKLGDTTAHEAGRISLNPLSHVDPFSTIVLPIITYVIFHVPLLAAKPVPFNPDRVKFEEFGAAMVALAGPFTNLALAISAAVTSRFFLSDSVGFDVLLTFAAVNVGLFVFNMIPIPPLDGSRLLYALAPESFQEFLATLEQYGFFIIFGLILAVPAFTALLISLNLSVLQAIF